MEKMERDLMDEGEFKKYLQRVLSYNRISPEAIGKYKSIERALRRGHLTQYGRIVPKRPFNNRANTSKKKKAHSRSVNEYKKNIYGQLIKYYKREAQ